MAGGGEAEVLPGVQVVPLPDDPGWVGRLQALDPCVGLFAHDLAAVQPSR
jgi:hypothetical protein